MVCLAIPGSCRSLRRDFCAACKGAPSYLSWSDPLSLLRTTIVLSSEESRWGKPVGRSPPLTASASLPASELLLGLHFVRDFRASLKGKHFTSLPQVLLVTVLEHRNTNSSSGRNWNQEWGTAGIDPIRYLFGCGEWGDFEI